MARPIILGVVGDSATGKTTITKGLVEILGKENVTHIGMDDYHKYDRDAAGGDRASRRCIPTATTWTSSSSTCTHLRNGEPILKPVYQHDDGTFGPPQYVVPKRFVVIEGLLGYHTAGARRRPTTCACTSRRPRSCAASGRSSATRRKRGYTEQGVLDDLDKREPDSEAFIRPQQGRGDIVVSFRAERGAATRTTSTRC